MTFDPEGILSREDLAVIDKLLKEAGTRSGLKKVFRDYAYFVSRVDGYGFSIYDYDNDLSVRDTVDEALAGCSEPLRDRVLAVFGPIDEAFLAKTVPYDRSFSSAKKLSENWHTRLPKNPGSELRSDIDSGNI